MNAEEAMVKALVGAGLGKVVILDQLEQAVRDLRGLSLAGVSADSDIWFDTLGRLFDIADRLPVAFVPVEALAPVSLVQNRADEVARSSSQAGLASLRLSFDSWEWPHTNPCHEQCEACGCCIHTTLACAARELPEGSLCSGRGCGCEGRS